MTSIHLPKRLVRFALLLALAPVAYFVWQVVRLPLIHDISTDTQDPPSFVTLLEQRRHAPNRLDYNAAVALKQTQAYPDIVPLLLPMPPAQAFAQAERVAHTMGWKVVSADAATLRIEATATTPLLGFKDDVVVRIRSAGQGSRVDMRSVSRVGSSDVGANAARIRTFFGKLR